MINWRPNLITFYSFQENWTLRSREKYISEFIQKTSVNLLKNILNTNFMFLDPWKSSAEEDTGTLFTK